MSTTADKPSSEMSFDKGEKKGEIQESTLDPVIEVNENVPSEIFDRPFEVGEFVEITPRIFGLKEVLDPLTIESLNNAIYELGVVNLCWPNIEEPVFETRTCFPRSYYTNSPKERLLLAYAENFRRQMHFHFKKLRKPLLLQAPNECGLQKMVCSTIRATKLCFTGTNTWQGLASLVADYFDYEPLTKPMLHPERIMSPYTALVRRSGNPFEIAHVLVSWLLGAGYDAYVVVGCAKRDLCMNIRYRTTCPDIPDENPQVEEETGEPEEEPRYRLVPLPDFTSKYCRMMAEREAKKNEEEQEKLEQKRLARIAELELPPPDPIDGWRTHAWVLVMPGFMGVELPFFIEPSQGNSYPLNAEQYQEIDAVYNNENYYANLQLLDEIEDEVEEEEEDIWEQKDEKKDKEVKKDKGGKKDKGDKKDKEPKKDKEDKKEKDKEDKKEKDEKKEPKKDKDAKKDDKDAKKDEDVNEEETEVIEEVKPRKNLSHLSYDFSDLSCWEHLLAGEPHFRRQLVGVDTSDKRTAVETEKHLDVPTSWVEKLDITADDYQQRYPGCHKVIHYKKVLLEKFSRYSQPDGIVKRVKIFEDYALTVPIVTHEYYMNRDDKMHTVRIDHVKNEIREQFHTGRSDHLIDHVYAMDAPTLTVEGNRTLEFNYYARVDHLSKIVCTPLTFDEYYIDREDRLESRNIVYTEGTKAEPKRHLLNVTETFRRNPDVPAKDDVWKKIFHIQDNTIELLYHYGYNFVTNDTRMFNKPNLAETGGKILFYPDKTTGYIADPRGQVPRPLNIYYALCNNMEREYLSTKQIRDRETDINSYLSQRHKELTEPSLFVSLFNTERNEAAQRGYIEQEKQKAEISEREKEAEIDPLTPYLARMFGLVRAIGAPLSVKEATLVREQCINDFRAKQLARQILVQERFDTLNAEYKAKRLWYLANQFILSPEKESAYFTLSAELAFRVHSLEVRLTRHRDLSAPRYRVLMDYLDKHPLLQEYNRMRHYHKVHA